MNTLETSRRHIDVIGLTGGIATGKSTAAAFLVRALGAVLFDSDAAVHQLMNNEARAEILSAFGEQVLGTDGAISRPLLRQTVTASPSAREILEGILHPKVRALWTALAAKHRAARQRLRLGNDLPQEITCQPLIVDIPLLFEVGADGAMDCVVVVGCSAETLLSRLLQLRNLDEQTARHFLAAQWPVSRKMALADHVLWNDGPLPVLERQVAALSRTIETHVRL